MQGGSGRRQPTYGGLRLAWRGCGARPAEWLPLLAAAAPFLAYASHLVGNFRSPIFGGDQALLEIWTRSALEGEALLGPYSRYQWNHPGPLLFYTWAPAYHVTGQSAAGLAFATLLINLALVLGIISTLRRTSGTTGAWIGTVVTTYFLFIAGPTWFDETWNPVVIVLPVAASLCTAAAVLHGRPRYLVVAGLTATFAVQSHLGTAPALAPAAALVCLATARGLLADRRVWLRPSLAAAAALLLVWAPPLYEQTTRNPGNVTQLGQDLRGSAGRHPLTEVLDASAPQFTLSSPDLMRRTLGRGEEPAGQNPASAVVLLCLLVLVVTLSARLVRVTGGRRPPEPRTLPYPSALGLIASASCLAAIVGFRQAKGPLSGYLTLSSLAVGLALVLALALLVHSTVLPSLASCSTRRGTPSPSLFTAMATGLVVVPSILLTTSIVRNQPPTLNTTRPDEASAVELEALDRLIPADAALTIDIVDNPAWPTATLVVNHLEREGWEVTSSDQFLFMFGDQRARTGCEVRHLAFRNPPTVPQEPSATVTSLRIGAAQVEVSALEPLSSCPR